MSPDHPWPIDQPVLQRGDLVLRPWRSSDVDTITAAVQDRLTVRFTRVPSPYYRADAISWVESSAGEWAQRTAIHYCGVRADRPNEPLVSVGLVHIDPSDRLGEIGYWAAPAARGQGFTSRSVRLLATTCLREWGFDRIDLLADVANSASQGVARAAGFQHEGTLRDRLLLRGVRRDAEIFSLIQRDLVANPPR